jgi:hypothetical protein
MADLEAGNVGKGAKFGTMFPFVPIPAQVMFSLGE